MWREEEREGGREGEKEAGSAHTPGLRTHSHASE